MKEKATNAQIYEYISYIKNTSEAVTIDMVTRQFAKTKDEAQQLLWAYKINL